MWEKEWVLEVIGFEGCLLLLWILKETPRDGCFVVSGVRKKEGIGFRG